MGSGSDSAVLDDGTHQSEAHADEPDGTLHVPKGHVKPPAPIEPEDDGARSASERGKPERRGRDQMRLRAFPIHEHPKDEDEAKRDHAQDREGEESRDRPRESQKSAGADEGPGEPIRVHGRPHEPRRCIRRRSASNGFRSAGMGTPASSTLSGRPSSLLRFQMSALKATILSVQSARDPGTPSRGIGNGSACTPPPYTDRQILSVENGAIGASSLRRSRRQAWRVHLAPVSPSYARAFTIST